MDEGWTRFVLEQYGFEPKTLDNKAMRAGSCARLRRDRPARRDEGGHRDRQAEARRGRDDATSRSCPPEYAGGLDKEGATALKEFVEAGGTLVALSASADYVIEEFNVPVRNGAARADEFAIPGSLLRAEVASGHPVTDGLPDEVAVFVDEALAFQTAPPGPELDRWVLASYPEAPATSCSRAGSAARRRSPARRRRWR